MPRLTVSTSDEFCRECGSPTHVECPPDEAPEWSREDEEDRDADRRLNEAREEEV